MIWEKYKCRYCLVDSCRLLVVVPVSMLFLWLIKWNEKQFVVDVGEATKARRRSNDSGAVSRSSMVDRCPAVVLGCQLSDFTQRHHSTSSCNWQWRRSTDAISSRPRLHRYFILILYYVFLCIKVKVKVRFTYVAPNLRISSLEAISSHTRPSFSLGRSRPSPHTLTLTCAAVQPHVALVCRLNGLYLRNPCKYRDYYSFTDPGVIRGSVGLVISIVYFCLYLPVCM